MWKAIFITILLVIIAGMVVLIANPRPTTPIELVSTPYSEEIRYGIFGAVKEPGYYSSENPLRIGEAVEKAGGLQSDADEVNAHLAKWIDDEETIIIPTKGVIQPTLTQPVPENEKVDLNSAGMKELMSLPGIGEKRAKDILDLREKKGRFERPEDLLEINGISRNLLVNIYDRLIIR